MTLLYGWLCPPERVAPKKRNDGSHRPDWLLSEAGILIGGVLPAFAQFLHLRRTTIDLVLDFPASFVSDYGIFALTCAEITAVSIDCFFLSRQ